MKILHHPIKESICSSIFHDTFTELFQDQFVKIMSPYISPGYFMQLIDKSSDWQLISDLETWMASISHNDRLACLAFIEANQNKIRHVSKLHAKLILNTEQAFLGSANLTHSGIGNNFELGILLEEPDQINSLDLMFNQLWEKGWPPEIQKMKPFVLSLEQVDISTPTETTIRLPKSEWAFPGFDYHSILYPNKPSTRELELLSEDKQNSANKINMAYLAETEEFGKPWLIANHLKSKRKSLIPIRVKVSKKEIAEYLRVYKNQSYDEKSITDDMVKQFSARKQEWIDITKKIPKELKRADVHLITFHQTENLKSDKDRIEHSKDGNRTIDQCLNQKRFQFV